MVGETVFEPATLAPKADAHRLRHSPDLSDTASGMSPSKRESGA